MLGVLLATVVAACSGTSADTEATAQPTGTDTAKAGPLFVMSDTVLGPTNLTVAEKTVKSCVMNSRFAHNEQIVWRVRVFDAAGQPMDDKALSKVEVKFADKTLKLKYGPHPSKDPVGYFWTVSWNIPADYPSGTLSPVITATAADGRTGTWEQIKVAPSMLTITDEVRPVLPAS